MNSKDEQEEREEYFNKKNITQGVQDMKSADFKLTEKYERRNYVDYSSQKKMDEFKDNQFNGSEVFVNKYGQKLLKNTDDPRHKPETDHIVAANRAHTYAIDSDLKHITDDDIKKAINRESNFELICKSWNTSKRHRSDKEFADNKNKKVPSYDFCIPNKECVGATDDNPCDLFNRIQFPVDEFFPPEKEAFVDCDNPDPTIRLGDGCTQDCDCDRDCDDRRGRR